MLAVLGRAGVARGPWMYARMRNVGALNARISMPGRADVEITDWPGMTMREARMIAGSVATMLEVAERANVVAKTELRDGGCAIRCTWRVG